MAQLFSLGVIRFMPIMTFLITLLVAFTAIVKLAQTIVEYKSAKAKQTSDAKTPAPVASISQKSQITIFSLWRYFNLVMRYLCFGFIFFKGLGIDSKKPATVEDVALIGLFLGLMILYDDTTKIRP